MTKIKTTLIVASMAIAMAGCAKKRPAVLPPAPVDQTAPVDPNAGRTPTRTARSCPARTPISAAR